MMAHRYSAIKRLPIAWLVSALAVIAFTTAAQAVPVFYLSTQSAGATPGHLNLIGLAPNATGTLQLWVNSDVRLAGVSLDLIEVGGAIKFTGLTVLDPTGPPDRWLFLDGPQEITNSAVNHIGGAAIPGVFGDGVGPGTQSNVNGPNVLLASIPYMVTGLSGHSDLRLRVGGNGIADFNGNFPQVRFGTSNAPLVDGDAFGSSGTVGTVLIHDCCGPGPAPVILPVNLGEVEALTTITANLVSSNSPVSWSALTPTVGTPALAATLSEQGVFSWNPAGSLRGKRGSGQVVYSWTAMASNVFGTDTRVAITLTLIPEPATAIVFGAAMIGLFVSNRRQSRNRA